MPMIKWNLIQLAKRGSGWKTGYGTRKNKPPVEKDDEREKETEGEIRGQYELPVIFDINILNFECGVLESK